MYTFNSGRFLRDEFVNVAQCHAMLTGYKMPDVKMSAVEKWFARNSVPGPWLPLLMLVIELDRGEPVRLTKYMETT